MKNCICDKCIHKEICFIIKSSMYELYIKNNNCKHYTNIIEELDILIKSYNSINNVAKK